MYPPCLAMPVLGILGSSSSKQLHYVSLPLNSHRRKGHFMLNQDNHGQTDERKIYIRELHEWVPVTKEFYDNYYREINTYRRRQQKHGRCECPASKRYLCNMDCWTCSYLTSGDTSSLNDTFDDGEGNEVEHQDFLSDLSPTVESIIEDQELLNRLFDALEQINPHYAKICWLWANGSSERDIAKALGIKSQSTLNYQRRQALSQLKEILKDWV